MIEESRRPYGRFLRLAPGRDAQATARAGGALHRTLIPLSRASLDAEHTAVSGMARLVARAEAWSGDVVTFQAVCVQGAPSGQVEEVTVTLVAPRSSLCTGALDTLSLSVPFKVVQISVRCDQASLKIATPGTIGTSFTRGDITASAGAGVEVPLTSAGVKAAGGFSVTLDSALDFKDGGVMAEAKASLGTTVGPITIGGSVKGVSGRWSLIAGPST